MNADWRVFAAENTTLAAADARIVAKKIPKKNPGPLSHRD